MRETRADTMLSLLAALLLHALLFALVAFGLWWTRPPVSAAGEPMLADVVDPDALSAAARRALAAPPAPAEPEEVAPPPQPLPEPRPEEAPEVPQPLPQEVVPEPDVREQVQVDRDAPSPEAAPVEQVRRQRQEQVDLTAQQRQQEAERRQRLSEMERQRLEQLADIRRQRAQAAREAQLAEQKLKQLADARARNAAEAAARADADASPPPGSGGTDASLKAQYAQAIAEAIRRNWTRPESVPLDAPCRLRIRQIPGGEVIDVEVSPACPYDELGRRSVEAAILKAQPLPYAGFESVFSRDLTLNFRARD